MRLFVEVDVVSAFSSSTTTECNSPCLTSFKQPKKEPPSGGSFPLHDSFLINQHMEFLYGLRMHKLARLRFLHQSSSQQMILTNDG